MSLVEPKTSKVCPLLRFGILKEIYHVSSSYNFNTWFNTVKVELVFIQIIKFIDFIPFEKNEPVNVESPCLCQLIQ